MLCMSVNLQHDTPKWYVVWCMSVNLHLQHLHIKEFPGFPFLDAWFHKRNIIILLITCCMQWLMKVSDKLDY